MSKFLVHVGPDTAHDVVEGRLYSFPSGKAVEVKDDFIADKIAEHLWHAGVVIVPVEVDAETGFPKFKPEEAKKAALVSVNGAWDLLFAAYVNDQLERAKKNQAQLPPEGIIAKIIEVRKIDLRTYGIAPVGYRTLDIQNAQEERFQKLQRENAELKTTLDAILARLGPAAPAPAPPPTEEDNKKKGTR